MVNKKTIKWEITYPLAVFSLVAVGFLFLRIFIADSYRYWFLIWNLILAWIPLISVIVLSRLLNKYSWSSWRPTLTSIIALLFLPNSFYLITDYIHLHSSGDVSLLFDVVLFGLFSFLGFLLGFLALYVVQDLLTRRFPRKISTQVILVIILMTSFAIYLGRQLRWNSWDVFINPFGLLYDVVDRIISPSEYSLTFTTTAIFFVFISTFYFCTRWLIRLMAKNISPK